MKNHTLSMIVAIHLLLFTSITHSTQWMFLCETTANRIDILKGIATLSSVSSVPTPQVPHNIVLTPPQPPNSLPNYAYIIANITPYPVYVMNLAENNSITATITTGLAAPGLGSSAVATPNGSYVYFAAGSSGTSKLCGIATATQTTLAESPFTLTGIGQANSMVIDSTGTKAYVSDSGSTNVLPITLNTGTGIPTMGTPFTVGSGTLGGLAITPDNSTLYVSNNTQLFPVTNLTSTPSVGTGITVFGTADSVIINSTGTTAYVTSTTGHVSIVNLTTQSTTTTISLGVSSTYFAALSSDGNYLYVTSTVPSTNGSISIMNTAPPYSVSTVTGYNNPEGLAIATINSGILDTTFGNQGVTLTPVSRQDQLQQAVIQTGDKIITTGITQTIGGSPATLSPSVYLAQYASGGVLDTGFNSSGIQTLLVGSRSEGNALALDSSTNILVAGFCAQPQTSMLLARYLFSTPGALDPSFNGTGYATLSIGQGATANAVGVQSSSQSNKIIVGGCSISNGIASFALARFTTAGVLDTTFGNQGITLTNIGNMSCLTALAIITAATNTDYIIAVGNVDNNIAIARYNASGILDTTGGFGTGGSGIFQPVIPGASSSRAYDVILDSSSNILVAGSANISGTNESLLIRCTPSGAFDTTFNTTGYLLQPISGGSEFYSVALQPNTQILAAGYAIGVLTNQVSLARYSTGGVADIYFGTNGLTLTTIGSTAAAQTIALQSTTNSIAAGTADDTFFVARFNS